MKYIEWIDSPLVKSFSALLLLLLKLRQAALGALRAGTEANNLRHIAIVVRLFFNRENTLQSP